jgi:integrase/recombinase XerD
MNNLTGRLEKEEKFYQKMDAKLKALPAVIGEYYVSMRANRKSYTTISVYLNNLLHFVRFVTNGDISDNFYQTITSSDIERYMISLETRQTKNGMKRTGDDILQARWSSLNHFFTWLVKRGYVTKNPIDIVDRPKNQTEHKVTYLTKIEINKLYKAINSNPIPVMAMRDKTLISLALSTALRVSALVNINIEDIDLENNVINVIEKRQKVRTIEFGEQTKKVLQDWIEVRNKEFGDVNTTALFLSQKKGRLSVDAVGDLLTKYCMEAGIKRITPHKLRATASCMMAKNNIPVKAIAKQLGHAQIATTMRYIDVFNEDTEKAINILDNLVQ